MEQTYQVLYTKSSTKKRKTYQDGQLLISSSSITLVDDQGKEVYKKKCYMPSIGHGEEVILGLYDVQVEGSTKPKTDILIKDVPISRTAALGYVTHTAKPNIPVMASVKPTVKATTSSYATTTKPAISAAVVSKTFVSKKFAPSNLIPSSTSTASEGTQVMSTSVKSVDADSSSIPSANLKSRSSSSFVSSGSTATAGNPSEIVLDTALIKLMRPHQIDAANFLIRRLLGEGSADNQEKQDAVVNRKPVSNEVSSSSTSVNCKKTAAVKKRLEKTQKMKKKKRKGMILDSDEEDSDSDDFSLYDSDSDLDDRCFEQKPPGFIREDPSLPPAVPLSTYTGAILADEVAYRLMNVFMIYLSFYVFVNLRIDLHTHLHTYLSAFLAISLPDLLSDGTGQDPDSYQRALVLRAKGRLQGGHSLPFLSSGQLGEGNQEMVRGQAKGLVCTYKCRHWYGHFVL
jgi:Protein of unknown function (DUF2439)